MITGRELVKDIEERYFADSLVLRGPLGVFQVAALNRSCSFHTGDRELPRRIVNRGVLS